MYSPGSTKRWRPPTYISEYIVPEVVDAFVNEQERIFAPIIAEMSRWFSRHSVMPNPAIAYEQFYQSDFYHLVLRPSNQYHALQARRLLAQRDQVTSPRKPWLAPLNRLAF